MASILIVEDDPKTAAAIAEGLQRGGHVTSIAASGITADELLRQSSFDVLILDWMLPGLSGIDVLARARARANRIPVLLLTARDHVDDRVTGLDRGADDYLVKPFALAELSARVRALIRRSEAQEPTQRQVADLVLDTQRRIAHRAGVEILLTPREFDVLQCLMRQQGQVVTRAMLADAVWRDVPRATPLDNVIDVHLAHLRRKIDEGQAVKLLRTIRGVGFSICAP
ncbi:MAG TPA: response regulator transcription factor [Steroidobacteraceae bacterium]|nr:response regulator transcription factor [Steroidobacteraceae bacterium]